MPGGSRKNRTKRTPMPTDPKAAEIREGSKFHRRNFIATGGAVKFWTAKIAIQKIIPKLSQRKICIPPPKNSRFMVQREREQNQPSAYLKRVPLPQPFGLRAPSLKPVPGSLIFYSIIKFNRDRKGILETLHFSPRPSVQASVWARIKSTDSPSGNPHAEGVGEGIADCPSLNTDFFFGKYVFAPFFSELIFENLDLTVIQDRQGQVKGEGRYVFVYQFAADIGSERRSPDSGHAQDIKLHCGIYLIIFGIMGLIPR